MSDQQNTIEHMFEETQLLEGSAGAANLRPPAELDGVRLAEQLGRESVLEYKGDEELFDLLQTCAQMESWLSAKRAQIVAALAPDESTVTVDGFTLAQTKREMVAVALNIAPRAAGNEVQYAHHLIDSCQGTFAALGSGKISARGARVIAEETYVVDSRHIPEIEAKVLPNAGCQIPSRIARGVRRAIHSLAPQIEAQAVEACSERRSVSLIPQAHGMATVEAYLPAAEAVSLYNVVNEIARCNKSRDRAELKWRCAGVGVGVAGGGAGRIVNQDGLLPMDAYRADALMQLSRLGSQVLSDEVESVRSGKSARVAGVKEPNPDRFRAHIVLDLATALGLANNPGELAQYGPIPAHVARSLAADSSWDAWITNASRQLQAVGSKVYHPAPSLRRFIVARDQVCQFPGCSSRAVDADLDHSTPYELGGSTSPENLHCLCRRHHRMKTHLRWDTTREPHISSNATSTDPMAARSRRSHSQTTWRLPTGHEVTVEPEAILADPVSGSVPSSVSGSVSNPGEAEQVLPPYDPPPF